MRGTLEPAGLSLGDRVARRIDAGGSCLALLPGVAARADLVAALAMTRTRPVAVFGALPDQYRAALLRAGSSEGRFGLLPPVTEPAEFSLRLAQYEAGVFQMLALAPEQAWLAEVMFALGHLRPAVLVVDLAGFAGGLHESPVFARMVLERVTRELPGTPVALVGDPIGPALLRVLLTGGSLEVLRHMEIVPAGMRLSAQRARSEHERVERIRRVCKERGRTITAIVAPTRGAATRLQQELAGRGLDCGLYHGGLAAAERITVLQAVESGRMRILVATEAVLAEAAMEKIELILFSHAPGFPEVVLRAASWAVAGRAIIMFSTAEDLPALPGRALKRIPTLAELRETYAYLRAVARGSFALTALNGETPAARRHGQRGQTSVNLALLELAGYCRRHDDFPRAAVLTRTSGDNLPSTNPAAPRLAQGEARALRPLQFAAELDQRPETWQRSLLAEMRAGRVAYRPHGRERLYELAKPQQTAAQNLSRLVADLSSSTAAAASRVAVVLASGGACRVQSLAAALSWPPVPPCGRCDRCQPDRYAPRPRTVSDSVLALEALASVPFSLRRGAVYRVVARALEEANRPVDRPAVIRLVDDLVTKQLLVTRPGKLGDLYAVGGEGRAALDAWDKV